VNLILFNKEEVKEDGTVDITGRRFVHIVNVLKANIGSGLRVGEINGLMGSGELVQISLNSVRVCVRLNIEPPSPLETTLILALPRPKAFRRIVEAVTTIGVKRIVVIDSANVESSYWDSPFLTADALNERMVLGLEQAMDTILPQISFFRNFKAFIGDSVPELIADKIALVAVPDGEKLEEKIFQKNKYLLCIGPDRGFRQHEVKSLEKAGFQAVSLGARILRVEQAVPVLIGRTIA
jgi:RsmE family RNA methyltransferase